jgi:hypothetical protein
MPPLMRRMVTILVLLATAGLLAVWGSSRQAAVAMGIRTDAMTGTRTEVVYGVSARVDGSLTKAQAKAIAHAVKLRSGDVAGFKVSSEAHEHETAAEKRLEREMLHCVDGAGLNSGLAEESSKDFERETSAFAQSVSSSVTIMQTPALATKELVAIRSERVQTCLSHFFDLLFKDLKHPRGATTSPVSISQATPPAPGTTGSFGWRITAAITERGVRIPFYIEILGFVYGPAEVTLITSGVPEPFPAATEQRLFSLLVGRAKASLG